jgi:hypothetical protein
VEWKERRKRKSRNEEERERLADIEEEAMNTRRQVIRGFMGWHL